MIQRCSWHLTGVAILIGACSSSANAQPTIVIDYSFDTNNFFPVGSPQRTTLQTAATTLTSRLTDSLTAITPNVPAGNTWTAIFDNPATGFQETISNPTIAVNVIRVYAGGRDLTGGTLGIGGPGGFSGGGSVSFLQSIGRGQYDVFSTPNTRTDFASWGGSITFDSIGTDWNYGLTAPSAGQADFLSVAEHELGHLLGIGTAPSWTNLVAGGQFTGTVSSALFGSNPPVTGDGAHWAEGTMYLGQEVAMDPTILLGTRKLFTELDYAGLDDLGWQVTPVPEPTTVLGVGVALAGFGGVIRRLRRKPECTEAPPATAI